MTNLENNFALTYSDIHTETTHKSLIYFCPSYNDHPVYDAYKKNLENLINCNIYIARTWEELIRHINCNISLVIIHSAVIKNHIGSGLSTFMSMLNNIIQYNTMSPNNPVIALAVDGTCTKEFIEKVKATNMVGIVPTASSYGTLATANAMETLLAGEENWPDDIINLLPSALKIPTYVFFRTDVITCRSPIVLEEIEQFVTCNTKYCTNWDELSIAMVDKPEFIVFHESVMDDVQVNASDFVKAFNILLKCNSCTDTVLGISITPTTSYELVQELMDNGIQCFVPGYANFGKDACLGALKEIKELGKTLSTNIIKNLPKITKKLSSKYKIHLTARQEEVLKLICNRGLSNKQIAKTLLISESTVKIHVSAVMKVYAVKNRTQLVLASNSGLKA